MSIQIPKRISGRDNPEFKRFLAVRARKNRDQILIEGPKLIEEAARSHLAIKAIATDGSTAAAPRLPVTPWFLFSGPLMNALSEVETHQGVIALADRPSFEADWMTQKGAFILILDGIQDPGNVGTLVRTAEAAGVCGVALTRGCADPLSPKALRASAGSAFRVPFIADLSPEELLSRLPAGIRLMAAVAGRDAASIFDPVPLDVPLALALGSEGSGLSPGIEAASHYRVRVPGARAVESLNVGVAGAIVMFEIARRAGILRD